MFVILYASSQVDLKKYKAVMSAFENVFGGEPSQGTLPGGRCLMSSPAVSSPMDVSHKMGRKVKAAIGEALKQDGGIVTADERGVTVHFLEKFMSDPGENAIKLQALPVLDTLGFLLMSKPNRIRVEGHTDDTLIHNARFPFNWHLSVARALNVGNYLLQSYPIRPEEVAIVGYGEYYPLVPNDTPVHKAENKRVGIAILDSITFE